MLPLLVAWRNRARSGCWWTWALKNRAVKGRKRVGAGDFFGKPYCPAVCLLTDVYNCYNQWVGLAVDAAGDVHWQFILDGPVPERIRTAARI